MLPITCSIFFRLMMFPKHRVAQAPNAQRGKEVDVFFPKIMTGKIKLVPEFIADPVNGTFYTTPYFGTIAER